MSSSSSSNVAQLQQMGQVAGTGPDEVFQHGTIGKFIRMELEGEHAQMSTANTSYVRAHRRANNIVLS